jgi:hypothetical protein
MKYDVEMGSIAMIYVPNFIQIGSGIQKVIGGIHRYTASMVIVRSGYKLRILSQECIYISYYSQNKQRFLF